MAASLRSRFPAPLLLALLAGGVAWLAVSSQSFWIDECETAVKAMAPTLHDWWRALTIEGNSNLQLPLYMIYIWGWARLFGVSEFTLRFANVPWFFLGFLAIVHFLRRRPGLRNAALLLYCLHPFVWFYLNEARPYLMQLSGALIVSGALFDALGQPEKPLPASWWWCFGVGVTILCGAGLLGVPWAASITLLLLGCPGFRQSMFRSGRPALLLFVPLLFLLALYFSWTLMLGARPGETGMTFSSIPFVFYEHLGFAGLGPGRAGMRSGGFRLVLSYAPALCLLGLPMAYALARAGAARFGLAPGRLLPLCLTVIVPVGFVFALGFAKRFLVLGRHLTPLFPFVLCALAYAVSLLWERRRGADRAVVALIIVALAVSALECRFAYWHEKDDYRDASGIAKAALARGERVWWAADGLSGGYYGLPLAREARPGRALLLWKPTPPMLAGQAPPALIILSKPDLFDPKSAVLDYIRKEGYAEAGALPAFSLLRKDDPPGSVTGLPAHP